MTKILTGGAVALVAVLAFVFGNNLTANQQANVKLAQIGGATFPEASPAKLPNKQPVKGSGDSGAVAVKGCNVSGACNYNANATGVLPMSCTFAYYTEAKRFNTNGTYQISEQPGQERKRQSGPPKITGFDGFVIVNMVRYTEVFNDHTITEHINQPIMTRGRNNDATYQILSQDACDATAEALRQFEAAQPVQAKTPVKK